MRLYSGLVIVKNYKLGFLQLGFNTFKPSTFSKCLTLFVTIINPFFKAVAEIDASARPIWYSLLISPAKMEISRVSGIIIKFFKNLRIFSRLDMSFVSFPEKISATVIVEIAIPSSDNSSRNSLEPLTPLKTSIITSVSTVRSIPLFPEFFCIHVFF